jgi:CRP/FNR family transcriptional regulator
MSIPHQGLWSKAPLFQNLSPEQLARVGGLLAFKHLEPGQVLFVAGEPCLGSFIVLEGAIQLLRPEGDGRETLLNLVRPPQSFAEAALFSGGDFPATARAQEASLVAMIPKAPFLALLRGDADLCLKMLESLAAWHHRLTFQVQQLRAQDGAGRLRRWLEDEAAKAPNREILLRVPKKVLAAQLGFTPETLSRLLSQLKREGLVAVDGPKIRVMT